MLSRHRWLWPRHLPIYCRLLIGLILLWLTNEDSDKIELFFWFYFYYLRYLSMAEKYIKVFSNFRRRLDLPVSFRIVSPAPSVRIFHLVKVPPQYRIHPLLSCLDPCSNQEWSFPLPFRRQECNHLLLRENFRRCEGYLGNWKSIFRPRTKAIQNLII